MSKLSIASLLIALIALTACGGSHVYIEEVGYDEYGYFGDDVAGRSYSATHIEMGVGSGNIYELDPSSLQLAFDSSATLVTGNKNCNAFQAEPVWYEFGLAFRFIIAENRICPIDLVGFPENIFIDDIFEIETYVEFGRQVIVLYSENQDIAIYLE